MRLTDREIKATKAESKDIFINDGRGLYLRVRTSGLKLFLYRYKVNDKNNWLTLGNYPSMSLSEARFAAAEAKKTRDLGQDPIEKKLLAQALIENEKNNSLQKPTVEKIYEEWFKLVISKRKDKGEAVKRIFEKDILNAIGFKLGEDVIRSDITKVLDVIKARGSLTMANRTLSLLKQMFAFAYIREMVSKDPTYLLKKKDFGGAETTRDRALTREELIHLNMKLPLANLYKPSLYGIYIILGTCARIGELTKAKWENVDFLDKKKWVIPAEDSKNGIKHIIFLSDFTVLYFELLYAIRTSNIYCYPNKNNDGHVDTKTITKQIRDRQLNNPNKILKGRSTNFNALTLDGGRWTPHDLRRTSATIMTSEGVKSEVVERCLNHTEENKMKKTYQRYDYSSEQKEAWNLLGKYYSQIFLKVDF